MIALTPEQYRDRWTAKGLSGQLRVPDVVDIDDSTVTTGPRHPDDYAGLIEELIDLGVMSRRSESRSASAAGAAFGVCSERYGWKQSWQLPDKDLCRRTCSVIPSI